VIRHKVIGLGYTRTCPLACAHCITESSPRAKGKMSVEQAKSYLSVIAKYTGATSFTGGEALLYHREIVQLAEFAKGLGLRVTCVSGAGWVRQEAIARQRIRALASAGLDRLAISWDAYHEEFNASERAVLLARVALEEGLEVSVQTVRPAPGGSAPYRAAFEGLPVQFDSIQLVRLGRAQTLPDDQFFHDPAPIKGRCETVLTPIIDWDGQVYACCGPSYYSSPESPLRLGDTREEPLEEILERAIRDPILEVISLLGPYGLYQLLKDSGAEHLHRSRSTYNSICDLCMDLTNSPSIISTIRNQVTERKAQAMLLVARMQVEGAVAV
jgi:MoaA/NifB/PqqE/SkfB family radical SAM enzyme